MTFVVAQDLQQKYLISKYFFKDNFVVAHPLYNLDLELITNQHITFPGPPMRKTVILHIGLPKTGTSFLQNTFYKNRGYLAGKKILYPTTGIDSCFIDTGHHLLAFDLFKHRRTDIADLYANALEGNIWERVSAEIANSNCDLAFLTSEIFALDICHVEEIQRIRTELAQFDVHLTVALRDINSFMESLYRQKVRDGFSGSIEGLALAHWDMLNWQYLVNLWIKNLAPQKLHILEYNQYTQCYWLEYVVNNIFQGRFSYENLVQSCNNNTSINYELALYILELNRSGVLTSDDNFVNDIAAFVQSRNVKTKKSRTFLTKNFSAILEKHCKWPEKPDEMNFSI